MAACRRIGDLVCDTYLDTDLRVHQAGSHEMNMGIIHGMARLYRKTGEPRYLAMAKEVLKDFEIAGDYYRTGWRARSSSARRGRAGKACTASREWSNCIEITGDETFRRSLSAPLGQHAAVRLPQHRRFLVGRAGNGQSLSKRRHRNLLRGRLAGSDDRRPAADRHLDDRRRPGADHAERHARLAASFRGLVHLQHADGRTPRSFAHAHPLSGPRRHAASELLLGQRASRLRHRSASGA